jgi:FkbM family methyltransferase
MPGFRVRFFSERIRSGEYHRKLSEVLANPSRFYSILISKLLPGLSTKAVDLKLKDGKVVRVREFWTLFLFDEIFIQHCYEAPEILKYGPFDTVIDIGANIGIFTMRTKQLWPNARIVAIEPHPDNYRYLQEHIEINQLRNIKTLQVGVAERCGSLELYLSPRNIAGHSLYKKTEHSISIPTCTFSDVLKEFGPDQKCGLLKIDCEGCEYALLSSLTQEIADRISCIIFEPTQLLYDVRQLNEKLALFGFETSKFGDLVVATKP